MLQSSRFFYMNAIRTLIDHNQFTYLITTLIILNGLVMGLETYPSIMSAYGPLLKTIDITILWFFVIELFLRGGAHGWTFFRNPWSWFDSIIICLSLLPDNEAFALLRMARVFRVLRLLSIFPRLRMVVEGLIRALPSIGSIAVILVIFMYVFAVIATKLYGNTFPDWFGSLEASLFSLFQVMTLEGWPDIVRTVMKVYPMSWAFFVIYILVVTFSVLNLFIAVMVDAMQKQQITSEDTDILR